MGSTEFLIVAATAGVIGAVIGGALIDDDTTAVDHNIRSSQSNLNSANKMLADMKKEEDELKEILAEMQKKDPNVKDVYYSTVDGQRVLNIVRVNDKYTNSDQSSSSDHPDFFESYAVPVATGALAGMAGAALANAIMSPSYAKTRPYNDREREDERYGTTSPYIYGSGSRSAYISNKKYENMRKTESQRRERAKANLNTIKSDAAKQYRQAKKTATIKTSRPAFKSSGSVRSSGYSGGRGS